MATVSGRKDVDVGLTHEQLREMYELMLLARALDERMWLLNRAGQAPFAVSGQGHEAAQAGTGFALDPSKDWLAPYYRDLTMALRFGVTPRDVMLHMLSRAADPNSGGRQMPGHYSSRKRRIFTGSSPIATQLPQAAGIAFAAKMRGEDSVVVTGFGDGATNLQARRHLPLPEQRLCNLGATGQADGRRERGRLCPGIQHARCHR